MSEIDEHGVLMLRPETEPVPESEEHARLIDLLFAGLRARFADRDAVVTERMAWFPDKSDTRIRLDPDLMIIFDRPKRRRVSYKAWAESGVAPAVIIEVKSPNDTSRDYDRRFARAVEYGVGEIVFIDPFAPGGVLVSHLVVDPEIGLRTVAVSASASGPIVMDTLGVTMSGGKEFAVSDEHGVWLDTEELVHANRKASLQAESATARAEAEATRADRLAAALREAGIDPDTVG